MSDAVLPSSSATGRSEAELEAAGRKALAWRRRKVLFWRLFLLAALLGLWELGARAGILDPFFYSRPTDIAQRLWEWATRGTSEGPLWLHLYVTMQEALIGFASGAIAGVAVGVTLGRNRFLADIFSVYIKVFNAIPRVVLAPIFILFFGLGIGSKIALAFVMVFFVVFSNAFQGVVEADRNLIANARILGASRWQVTRHVVLPSAMGWIFASLHVSFAFGITGAIVGEFVGSRHGIGLLINIARGTFDSAGMYAAIVVILVVALTAEFLMTLVEKRLAKWRPAALHEGE